MNILLADDHALFRESLSLALARLSQNTPQIFQAETGERALDIAKKKSLDLALLDLDMPGMGGLAVIEGILHIHPNTPIVMISANEDLKSINTALSQGAKGFIPKTTPAEVTLSALRLVLSGGIYLPPQLMQTTPKTSTAATSPDIQLTERQIEVLRLLQQGTQNKNIAFELGLSPSTVKVHIRRICTALGAKNRTDAVNIAIKKGIL